MKKVFEFVLTDGAICDTLGQQFKETYSYSITFYIVNDIWQLCHQEYVNKTHMPASFFCLKFCSLVEDEGPLSVFR